jgi:subtilase family serine protease
MRKRSITATLITASTLVVGALVAPAASASPAPTTIPNTKPTWLASAQHLGHASASSGVSARIYLTATGGTAALKAQVLAVSTPGSAQFRKFLTAAQYNAEYGVTGSSVSAVEKWAKSTGLKVIGVGDYNRYISVTGTVAAAQKAFGSQIDRYNHAGQTVQAPTTAVTVPASIAAKVLTVTGLDTTVAKSAPTATPASPAPPAGFNNARPCSTYYGSYAPTGVDTNGVKLPKFNGKALPYAVCGYTGPQFRAAYEQDLSLDGTGATVAIIDAYASPYIAADANTYAINHGDGAYTKGQLTQNVTKPFTETDACGETGWWGEETLDVEAVHAMAPGAKIRYYGGASCEDNDLTDALAKVVNDDKAQIVTNSYGDTGEAVPADEISADEQVFFQAALEGISIAFSSGDDGDDVAATGLKQVDYEASDPYVTAVGGTATAIDANGALAWQTGWGTDKFSLAANGKSWTPVGYLYGSGGGSSSLFNQPSYQVGVTPGPYRDVPDVAMDADPTTGMLVGQTQTFPNATGTGTVVKYGEYRIGGTSLASPLYAGFTALAIGANHGHGFGFLNPTIYANAKSGAFTDVKGAPKDAGNVRVDFANEVNGADGLLYSVRTFNQDASLKVTKGWDNVTGLGSPNLGWLSALLSS